MTNQIVYAAAIWSDLVKRKSDYVCSKCKSDEDVQAVHLCAPSLGGKSTLDNGMALCSQCRTKDLIPTQKIRFNFSVPDDLFRMLDRYCRANGRSGNDVVKQLVADFTYDTTTYLNGFHEDASKNDRRLSIPVLRMVYTAFIAKCARLQRVPTTVIKSLMYLYLKPFEGTSYDTGWKEDREVAARLRQQRDVP
jgi:hypothetical protein